MKTTTTTTDTALVAALRALYIKANRNGVPATEPEMRDAAHQIAEHSRKEATVAARVYRSQSARDAQAQGYGDQTYWEYLENTAFEHHGYFRAKGDWKNADAAFTNSLFECLKGNDGP